MAPRCLHYLCYALIRMDKKNKHPNLRLRVHHSLEEATDAELLEAANTPPIEGIRQTVALILRTYNVTAEQLKARPKKLHITITRSE